MAAFGKTMEGVSAVISNAKIESPNIAGLDELRELEEMVEKYQKAADWVKAQDHSKYTTVKVNHSLNTIHECDILIQHLGCAPF